MSRQYGGSNEYWKDYSPGDSARFQPQRTQYNQSQQRQSPQRPVASQQPMMRSPPRKPIASYGATPYDAGVSQDAPPPPPPPHRSQPQSPPRQQYQTPTIPARYDAANHTTGPARMASADMSQPYSNDSQALRDVDNLYGGRMMSPSPEADTPLHNTTYSQRRPLHQSTNSQNSMAPMRTHAAGMAFVTPSPSPPRTNRMGLPAAGAAGYGYGDNQHIPASRSAQFNGYDTYVDPHDIADEGDDGFECAPVPRHHFFGDNTGGTGSSNNGAGILGGFGGMRDSSGTYGRVAGGMRGGDPEKSAWLKSQTGRSHRQKYIFGAVGIIIVCALIAGVVGGVIVTLPGSNKSGSTSSSTKTASDPTGEYTLNSPQVQAVLNNKDLHKVFPGMDYTPLNAQYPACLSNPPNQDNITLDVAVLSQLAPAIRLYGTDCNQTQMLLTAIERLQMTSSIKVWLGVWLENNSTTNTRQLNQMYEILNTYPTERFAGVIVGNEVLFREDMTASQLSSILNTVRRNLKAKGINLPVSTSDIGSAWDVTIAAASDIVMANVHPFFAGVKPNVAAAWTWDFWTNDDVVLAENHYGQYPKSIISETGWPTQGGNDCGTGKKCPTKTDGAIASVPNLNTFMDGWICQSLANGTTYFWFEAFDQPWTYIFNDPQTGDYWEPHWGLMDVDRNLKSGVKIPDCNGKTIDRFY